MLPRVNLRRGSPACQRQHGSTPLLERGEDCGALVPGCALSGLAHRGSKFPHDLAGTGLCLAVELVGQGRE
jgi:hypothetical protein